MFLYLQSLLEPDLGLIVWTTLIFLLVLLLLYKLAWNPILEALRTREDKIEGSLHEAEKVRADMANLKAENLALLQQAQEERAQMLREAKALREEIIAEAKEEATEQKKAIVNDAAEEIERQKMAALVEVKNLLGQKVLSLSKDVLKRELDSEQDHKSYIEKEINNITLS